MSDFGEALFELLPEHSELRKINNTGRIVIDKTVGEWFDNHSILDFYNNLFLNSSSGGYLDLFGEDYGVYRQLNEDDENYRTRIIQEKLEHLTPKYLDSLYDIVLYTYVNNFNIEENSLTSDNPYIHSSNGYMADADENLQEIIEKKFIVGENVIEWF